MEGRLPAHVEVGGLIRAVEAAGGFATVLQKGEKDAGSILVLTMGKGEVPALWERMPQLDGSRPYRRGKQQDPDKEDEFQAYCERRMKQDPDCWVVELNVPNSDRFIPGGKP